MKDKHIVLFDMDGTLTEARKPINPIVIDAVKQLSRYARVGIITGSGLDYLVEQCNDLWDQATEEYLVPGGNDIILMPCNGTQVFKKTPEGWSPSFSADMIHELGQPTYNALTKEILKLQAFLIECYDIPLIGEFVSYRKSLINWCPIGRAANDDHRNEFIILDDEKKIRASYLRALVSHCQTNDINVVCKLGGQTSIDVYPTGWDKSFGLQHLKGETCWFVGDRCTGTGNDKEIYDTLLVDDHAYQTTGPETTVAIIKDIILRIKIEQEK